MPGGEYLLTEVHDGTPLATERFRCAAGPAGWRYHATRYLPSTSPVSGGDRATEVTGRVDVTVDSRWRPARVDLMERGWRVRGGSAGRRLLWTRGLAEVCQTAGADLDYVERETEAAGFAGFSPAFLVCAAKLITTGAAALGAVPPGAVTAGAVTPGAVTAEAMTLETVTPGANSAGAQPGGAESVGAELTLVEFAPASLAATTVRQRWRYLGRSSHEQSGLTVVVDSWTVLDRDTGMGGEVHLDGEVVLSAPGVELLARDISS